MLQKHNNQNGASKLQDVLGIKTGIIDEFTPLESQDSESDAEEETEFNSDDDYAPKILALTDGQNESEQNGRYPSRRRSKVSYEDDQDFETEAPSQYKF